MELRPVLYLDLDDTLVSWRDGAPRAAPGAGEFVRWALERFELRWLTTWCPDGEMPQNLLSDLGNLLGLDTSTLRHIRGFDWAATESKLNGLAWLEHLVLGRRFLWVEDDYGVGAREISTLKAHGFAEAYRKVNVTEDPFALQRLHRELALDPEFSAREEPRFSPL